MFFSSQACSVLKKIHLLSFQGMHHIDQMKRCGWWGQEHQSSSILCLSKGVLLPNFLFVWTNQTLALQLPDLLFVWLKTKLDFNRSYYQIKVDCCSSTLSTQKGTGVNFHIILCQIWVCTWDTPHTMIFISITDSSTLTIFRNFIINVNQCTS